MKDFTQIDLVIRSHIADREREARAIAGAISSRDSVRRLLPHPRRWRAALAAKLTGLALHIDREAAGTLVAREVRTAGRR